MYYVSYYSKPKGYIGMSEAEINRQYEIHNNKIITKVILAENPDALSRQAFKKNKIIAKLTVLYQEYSELCSAYHLAVDDNHTMYHEFTIPKASGGYRTICAPCDELKDIQRRLLKIFTKDLKCLPHNAVHGFTKRRNCKTALMCHQKNESNWFCKLDIKNFFPSCTSITLAKTLLNIYPFNVLGLLYIQEIIRMCTRSGDLPSNPLTQGAPTSPYLANLMLLEVDYNIYSYCKQHDLIYTRYADDMLISSRKTIDIVAVQNKVREELSAVGCALNGIKTRYGQCAGRNWNLGLMYNAEHDITVGHKHKKNMTHAVHNFLTKPEVQTKEEQYRLLGELGYCYYIEPDYFKPYLDKVKAIEIQ